MTKRGRRASRFGDAIDELERQISELVNVAGAYREDDAPTTAAQRLRQAADLLDKVARLKDAYYSGVATPEDVE